MQAPTGTRVRSAWAQISGPAPFAALLPPPLFPHHANGYRPGDGRQPMKLAMDVYILDVGMETHLCKHH